MPEFDNSNKWIKPLSALSLTLLASELNCDLKVIGLKIDQDNQIGMWVLFLILPEFYACFRKFVNLKHQFGLVALILVAVSEACLFAFLGYSLSISSDPTFARMALLI